ncbi:MAG: HPr family phosphocarrier protein [Elusimicrobiales bacterium]|jgi:phosphocarrier protein|nr:HPr family phosphocarrier protein [Elusimicrobiales bacterium]HOJ87102.1 HPr family phosphocarrier protein [Elusimicrobiales bacterium]HOL61748.1 HPr family phosphocarrier protein [Elusimicrobiales bacterium]HPO94656.1 HPr family phosphocarrier protein [Elusimicrobiales bacterium]
MIKKEITVKNEQGLHARPCGMLSNTAMRFESEIKIIKEGYEVNAKSVMGLLTLAASKGSKITLIAVGRDEEKAVEEIEKLFESKFDEE